MTKTRVLVVEDHAMLRKVLASTLDQLGYEVEVAANGDAAINALNTGLDVDVVLTDIRMPGSANGLEVARWVRQHRGGCVVLLMSAYSDIDTLGFTLLPKPFTDTEMSAAIEKERQRGK